MPGWRLDSDIGDILIFIIIFCYNVYYNCKKIFKGGSMLFYICLFTGLIGGLLFIACFVYFLMNRKDPVNRITIKYINIGVICCVIYGFLHNVFTNPLYFNGFINLDFSNIIFQAFLVSWFWRGTVFFLIFAVTLNLLLRRAKRIKQGSRFMNILIIQSSLIILAWLTNFEILYIGKFSFNHYEILRWIGGFMAIGMIILILMIYMEKDIQEYLNITEIYISIRGRLMLNFMGIIALLIISLFSILFGCLGIDRQSVLLFKLIFYTALYLIPLMYILVKTTHSFSSNVEDAVTFLKFAANQDFTHEVTIDSRDEFGELENSLVLLRENFQKVIKTARISSEEISQSGENIDTSIKNLRDSIDYFFEALSQNTTLKAESTSKASGKMEEMVGSISEIFNNIKNQAGMVEESSSSIEEMTANIYSITERTKNASEISSYLFDVVEEGKILIEKTSQGILDIESASKQIFEMNQMIDNVSEQTEMLAMNAAIEASHAGDVGKGFAIVASEMRNLAETTRQNAATISNLVNDILKKIKNTLEYSKKSDEGFLKIHSNVDKTRLVNAEIANAMEQQSAALKEVLATTTSLVTATGTIGELSSKIKINSDEIKSTFIELNNSSVKEGEAIELNSKLVLETVQKVNSIIEHNKQIARELLNIIRMFKLEE